MSNNKGYLFDSKSLNDNVSSEVNAGSNVKMIPLIIFIIIIGIMTIPMAVAIGIAIGW